MNIVRNINFTAYRNCRERAEKIRYIVIHYTGAEGTAADNVKFTNTGNRSASAHYFVDRSGEIREYCDPAKWYAWHCGGPLESDHHPYYGQCTNANSIGIEICTHNNGTNWEFTKEAVAAAEELVSSLMKEFDVPAGNVIRHWDVTGKSCPRVSGWGAVGGNAEFEKFAREIGAGTVEMPKTEEKKWYRVRKSWEDAASQIGAFTLLDKARECVDQNPGYTIFDGTGKEVDPAEASAISRLEAEPGTEQTDLIERSRLTKWDNVAAVPEYSGRLDDMHTVKWTGMTKRACRGYMYPDTKSEVSMEIPQGTAAGVCKGVGKFYLCRVGDVYGYVHKSHMTK